MTRLKFIRLSGWALMLAAIVLVAGFGIGGGETRYDDPLGGFDAFYEYSQLILIPASLFLYTVGMTGLRLRYGEDSGWLGRAGLFIAAVSAGASFIAAMPLFALVDDTWMGPWWNLMVYSMLGMMVGISVFGLGTIQHKPLPRWNALPLITGVWFPVVAGVRFFIQLLGGNIESMDGYMAFVALLFMFFGSIILGYILQKETSLQGTGALI